MLKNNTDKCVVKVHMRSDQSLVDRIDDRYQDYHVILAAPDWVQTGLRLIRQTLNRDIVVDITDSTGRHETEQICGEITLKNLQLMARNESWNGMGEINFGNFQDISPEIVYALKDLVRQCVIIGRDWTTHYGGYPKGNQRIRQKERVYICDLIGLQFQNDYNSGRLVLISDSLPKGLLDQFIYEQVVGEKKPTSLDAVYDKSERFEERNGIYFDKKAYIKFVAKDVLITGLALDHCVTESVNFKFLKYGTGYFAGSYRDILESLIGQGVAQGLAELLPRQQHIKSIELPFYDQNPIIDKVCAENNVQLKYGRDDALLKTHPNHTTATTNCADPHASIGNKMGFGSIDGAIAENLDFKAMKLCPIINKLITQNFIIDQSYEVETR